MDSSASAQYYYCRLSRPPGGCQLPAPWPLNECKPAPGGIIGGQQGSCMQVAAAACYQAEPVYNHDHPDWSYGLEGAFELSLVLLTIMSFERFKDIVMEVRPFQDPKTMPFPRILSRRCGRSKIQKTRCRFQRYRQRGAAVSRSKSANYLTMNISTLAI